MKLRKISQEELKEILELHKKWLNREEGGKRADLSYTDLSYTDLSYTNLIGTNLSYANLSYVDLSCSNLTGTNLTDANFYITILYKAKDLLKQCKANIDNMTQEEFNEVLASLSHTNYKDKACGYNVNGKCIRSSNDKENTKIGVCWQEIGEGGY